jgi:type IV pilus biogenesis protein CpaD/CtpE
MGVGADFFSRRPMKKSILMCALLLLAGCASVSIPNYIQPEHPYKRVVYGNYDEVLAAVKEVLKDQRWTIVKETHPALYERNAAYSETDKEHALIFTGVKQSSRLVYSSFSHLNVYINRTAEGMELDVRYEGVTDFFIKKIHHYRNDPLADRFLNLVEQKLILKK